MMTKLSKLLLAGLLGAGLYFSIPKTDSPCKDGKCPVPPAPARPTPPLPEPPKPRRPCPGPWDTTISASVEAGVGRVAPDGTEPHCDLPGDLQMHNCGGSDGAGLCVFTSIAHSARWQGVKILEDFRDWMRRYPGGGYPEKVAKMIQRKCQEAGQPIPNYVQVEGSDLEVLKLACRTGRMPGVTYSFSPTGRYGGGRISHMVSLVHADDKWFGILDNNYPGPDKIEWVTPNEFRRTYTGGSGGWAVILLEPGPPPPPRGRVAGIRYGQPARARLEPLKVERKVEQAKPVIGLGGYEWRLCTSGKQIALHYQGQQIGNYRLADGLYYEYLGRDRWAEEPSPPPVPPPAWAQRVTNYGVGPRSGEEHYRLNGREVSRASVIGALTADGQLEDDSHLPRLTVIGPEAERKQVLADLASHPALAAWRGRLVVKDYDPGRWEVTGAGFFNGGHPTIYVQKPDGTVLHRQDDYIGGAEALASALRKADPTYRPDQDKDRRKENPLLGPLSGVPIGVLFVGAAGAYALLARKEQD